MTMTNEQRVELEAAVGRADEGILARSQDHIGIDYTPEWVAEWAVDTELGATGVGALLKHGTPLPELRAAALDIARRIHRKG